ncbi:MAG: hypothetical protein RLZZ399_2136, partial [Verrucomicrobiota bacterium]
ADAFRTEEGVDVHFQFGGSGTLLSQIKVSRSGDLFVSADDISVEMATRSGHIREVIPFAVQTPVIGVRRGNPKCVRSFEDLFQNSLRVAVANPEAASIGKTVRTVAGSRWEALAARVAVMKPTVTEIAADLSLGAVDAAIVWEALTLQFQGIEGVHVPELDAHPERASAAVLTASKQPAVALKFARFLAAPEKGGAVLAAAGYVPLAGDHWSRKPNLALSSGGVNGSMVESLLQRFATREGATVTTVFNGCGVSCAALKTARSTAFLELPDARYACDLCWAAAVADQFPEAAPLTETEIGMVVQRGNPRKVHTLGDLAQSGLRVGLCRADQSTLGHVTRHILKSSGLWEGVRQNVVLEEPTADSLISQMRTGALDAVIVYKANVSSEVASLEFCSIAHAGAKAVQCFAVRADSPNRQLALRFLDALRAHRADFEKAGFEWRGNSAPIQSKAIEIPGWLREE